MKAQIIRNQLWGNLHTTHCTHRDACSVACMQLSIVATKTLHDIVQTSYITSAFSVVCSVIWSLVDSVVYSVDHSVAGVNILHYSQISH